MRFHKVASSMAVALCLMLIAGCGEKRDGVYGITGDITLGGTPLNEGGIKFIPVDPAVGTLSGTTISNGKYSIPADKGLVPGEYTVQISSVPSSAAPSDEPPGPEASQPVKDRIPPAYGSKSTQKVTVSAENTKFNFDIP